MFGKNQVAPLAHASDGQTLAVNSIFYTIQGEGPHAGEPAVFIRLAGCNLRCHFCDTEFERSEMLSSSEILERVRAAKGDGSVGLVVLTGGEPLRQQIIPLLVWLNRAGFITQIETAGTLWPPALGHPSISLEDLIHDGTAELVCSPKTKALHPKVVEHCRDYKYIIKAGEISARDGLPAMSTQLKGHRGEVFRPELDAPFGILIWVQPCYEYSITSTIVYNEAEKEILDPLEFPVDHAANLANAKECARVAMAYGYRVSIQLHKILGLE